MANSRGSKDKEGNDAIKVSAFKEINIHFPDDVYLLAVWLAMSDRAKSTSTCKRRTTLHGLASTFALAYGTDYSNPLSSDDVVDIIRSYGIQGNPRLQLDGDEKPQLVIA